jgi:hypothetical protein
VLQRGNRLEKTGHFAYAEHNRQPLLGPRATNVLDHFAVTATWDTLGATLRQRYDGICDRTQLYPAFQPSLDDPRLQAIIKEMNQAAR